MDFLLQYGVILALIVIGLLFGTIAEKRHFRSLAEREAGLRDILVFAERRPPSDRTYREATLVVGSVVLGEDYFKRVSAGLKSFFGGRLTMYESLMDRGRREAIVRMKEAARERGATLVFNVHFATSSLAEGGAGERGNFSAEFIAYGTALVTR